MVGIYLPMIPEVVVAMLACARIGAPHNVVFGGFSAEAVRGADGVLRGEGAGHRRRRPAQGQDGADQAARSTSRWATLDDAGDDRRRPPHRDRVPDAARAATSSTTRRWRPPTPECPAEPMEAEHPLYILYTSGSTAKPKGILHTTGGYMTGVTATHRYVFDLKPETDVYWCAADVGWVTGHSYIVYGPLANGATSVMWEGAPDYPHKGIWWELIERYKATILYAAPTAIRTFIKWGAEIPERFDLSSLRLLGLGRRADQPQGLALVPQGDRRRALPDRRHLVADGDRRDHDHAAAGDHRDQARLGDDAVPGVEAEVVDESEGEPIEEGQGLLVLRAALALDAARPLQGGRALRRDLLLALRARSATWSATPPGATPTATSG